MVTNQDGGKDYQETGEDTEAHERLGLRIDDSNPNDSDLDESGRIRENKKTKAWG